MLDTNCIVLNLIVGDLTVTPESLILSCATTVVAFNLTTIDNNIYQETRVFPAFLSLVVPDSTVTIQNSQDNVIILEDDGKPQELFKCWCLYSSYADTKGSREIQVN